MPTGALHSHYWPRRGTGGGPALGTSTVVSYPAWQSVIIGAGFGVLQAAYEWVTQRTTTQPKGTT